MMIFSQLQYMNEIQSSVWPKIVDLCQTTCVCTMPCYCSFAMEAKVNATVPVFSGLSLLTLYWKQVHSIPCVGVRVCRSYCFVGVVDGVMRWTVVRGEAVEVMLYSSRLAPGAGFRVT